MEAELSPNYLLQDIKINQSLEIEINIQATNFDLIFKGSRLQKQFLNQSANTFLLSVEPSVERSNHLEIECNILNKAEYAEKYELTITFFQGKTICGQIEKSGTLVAGQLLQFNQLIWFPFV
jgi:hypothetical protein